MSNEVSFETYQWASGHYLTQPLPDNWYDMTTEDQNNWLYGYACDLYELWNAGDLWAEIDHLANDAHKFFSSKGRT